MKKAIFPGSFDPVTNGHLDIIKRARLIFDEVTVLILNNINKKNMFSDQERKYMIELITKDLDNIKVDIYNGLLVDYINNKDFVIIKGVRSIADFEYEFEMAMINRKLNKNAETMFFLADQNNIFVSSTTLKQLLYFDGDISWLIPREIEYTIRSKIKNLKKGENRW